MRHSHLCIKNRLPTSRRVREQAIHCVATTQPSIEFDGMNHLITTVRGTPACPLGLAAYPQQSARCVGQAFDGGINYFFFYGPGSDRFLGGLAPLVRKRRDEIILATGSGARKRSTLIASRRKIVAAVGSEMLDVFFAEYVHGWEDTSVVFGDGGVLDELQQWKADGWIRYVGATTHDRKLAKQLAQDRRVDVLMHRFNMAHRKAAREVFPTAIKNKTPLIAFTATRWGTLLEAHTAWPSQPPTAADCYRYCLAHPAVHIVLTAPRTSQELEHNLTVLKSPRMRARERAQWERFGDLVHGPGADAYEVRWP